MPFLPLVEIYGYKLMPIFSFLISTGALGIPNYHFFASMYYSLLRGVLLNILDIVIISCPRIRWT